MKDQALTDEHKDIVAAIYGDGGSTVWNGILQGREIGLSYELQDLGLAKVSHTQYHGNMKVSLTKEGKWLGKGLSRSGYVSSYSVAD